MQKLLINFLLSGSICCLFSCRTIYSSATLVPVASDSVITSFRPAFGVGLYKAAVHVTGHYLSGLVVIKKMPDSSMRVVFTSEAGPGYFDFSWPDGQGFEVLSIIPQLNKKAVIKTLRKDFELVLMNRLHQGNFVVREDDSTRYYIYDRPKGYDIYVTDPDATALIRMERSSRSKVVAEARLDSIYNGIPKSIHIRHLQFNFDIRLTQIDRHVEE